ncbi:hypothetical protein HanOQP8_Chr02g0054861 [Helianthus annuus]|nr:hypothetical protein HanOQP8_Chr02g0054861 [Helianthus annuus]
MRPHTRTPQHSVVSLIHNPNLIGYTPLRFPIDDSHHQMVVAYGGDGTERERERVRRPESSDGSTSKCPVRFFSGKILQFFLCFSQFFLPSLLDRVFFRRFAMFLVVW